jgi:DNA primase
MNGNGAQPNDPGDPAAGVERELLKLAIQQPGLCGPEFDALGAGAFIAPGHATVFMLIAACGGTASAGRPRDWVARLREAAPDEGTQTFIAELAVDPLKSLGEADASYADSQLARVGELAVSREITAVKSRLQRINPLEDEVAHRRMFGDLMALETRRRALLNRAAGS